MECKDNMNERISFPASPRFSCKIKAEISPELMIFHRLIFFDKEQNL